MASINTTYLITVYPAPKETTWREWLETIGVIVPCATLLQDAIRFISTRLNQ